MQSPINVLCKQKCNFHSEKESIGIDPHLKIYLINVKVSNIFDKILYSFKAKGSNIYLIIIL